MILSYDNIFHLHFAKILKKLFNFRPLFLGYRAGPHKPSSTGLGAWKSFLKVFFLLDFSLGSGLRPEPQLEIKKKKDLQKTLPERAEWS